MKKLIYRFDESVLKVETAKILILCSASREASFARIPMREKSRIPWMRKAFQPFSF